MLSNLHCFPQTLDASQNRQLLYHTTTKILDKQSCRNCWKCASYVCALIIVKIGWFLTEIFKNERWTFLLGHGVYTNVESEFGLLKFRSSILRLFAFLFEFSSQLVHSRRHLFHSVCQSWFLLRLTSPLFLRVCLCNKFTDTQSARQMTVL